MNYEQDFNETAPPPASDAAQAYDHAMNEAIWYGRELIGVKAESWELAKLERLEQVVESTFQRWNSEQDQL